jgi:glycosyltransferase involved in cell wall biosynthesis
MNKAKLSVYILAYNEEEKIEDCVKSATWADEVVVIDSHSTDKTAEIAESLGAKVVQVDFEGFGKIRMSGIEHTQFPWILSIDADERFTEEARQEVEEIINSEDAKDAYYIPRRNLFMGKKIRFCGWYPRRLPGQRKQRLPLKLYYPDTFPWSFGGFAEDGQILRTRSRKTFGQAKEMSLQTQYFLKKLVDFRQDLLSSPRVPGWLARVRHRIFQYGGHLLSVCQI